MSGNLPPAQRDLDDALDARPDDYCDYCGQQYCECDESDFPRRDDALIDDSTED